MKMTITTKTITANNKLSIDADFQYFSIVFSNIKHNLCWLFHLSFAVSYLILLILYKNMHTHTKKMNKSNFYYLYLLKRYNRVVARSSHQRCSIKKDVLENFAKFTGKHLYRSLLFDKVCFLPKACNFIKK